MTTRITDRDLKATIDRLNRLTNQPSEPYSRDPQTGRLTANIGNYHLSSAYGGVCIHQMVNEGGGVRTPISTGYTTKRDLYNQLHAYIRGIESAHDNHGA